MKNKKFVIVGVVVFILLLVIAGIILLVVKKESKSDNAYGNKEYTECVNEANALAETNKKIADQVDADIEKCTRDYIKGKGFNDNYLCFGSNDGKDLTEDSTNTVCNERAFIITKLTALGYTDSVDCVQDYNNPICTTARYDAEIEASKKYTKRYNAEVDGSNQCNKDREAKLQEAGYKNDIVPAIDCMKFLGK